MKFCKEIDVTLGWLLKSSGDRSKAHESAGGEKYSLNRFEGSLTTTPSSIMHVLSELSSPEDGNSDLSRFQNPRGVDEALAVESMKFA